jgi:hypothetical protein
LVLIKATTVVGTICPSPNRIETLSPSATPIAVAWSAGSAIVLPVRAVNVPVAMETEVRCGAPDAVTPCRARPSLVCLSS